jgi:hypothetical protein
MKPTKLTNRRKFLMAAGLGTAGVAAAVVTNAQKGAAGGDAQASTTQANGYHVTEHIQKYYKTTEV